MKKRRSRTGTSSPRTKIRRTWCHEGVRLKLCWSTLFGTRVLRFWGPERNDQNNQVWPRRKKLRAESEKAKAYCQPMCFFRRTRKDRSNCETDLTKTEKYAQATRKTQAITTSSSEFDVSHTGSSGTIFWVNGQRENMLATISNLSW